MWHSLYEEIEKPFTPGTRVYFNPYHHSIRVANSMSGIIIMNGIIMVKYLATTEKCLQYASYAAVHFEATRSEMQWLLGDI